jgi:hypothetical protein
MKGIWFDNNIIKKNKSVPTKKLTSTIFDMKEEVTLLNSKLENMTKYVKMLKKGSDILDETLEVGKRPGDMKGIWFDNNIIKKNKSVPKKKVPPKKKTQEQMSDHMSQHSVQHKCQKSDKVSQHPAKLMNQKSDNMPQHHVQHRSPQLKNNKKPTWRCHHLWTTWTHKALLLQTTWLSSVSCSIQA